MAARSSASSASGGARRRVAALLLSLLAAGPLPGCGGGSEREFSAVPVEIVDLRSLEEVVARQRGRPFLLNFWAMWCPPCVAELPELAAVAHAYRSRGADVLCVSYDLMVPNVDRSRIVERTRSFLAERELDLATWIYDGPDYDAINDRFDLPGPIPVTLAFDSQGRIVDRQEEAASRERFEQMLEKALAR